MNEITINTKHGSDLSDTHVKETFDILHKIDGYFISMKQSFFDIGKGMVELKDHFEKDIEHNYNVDGTYVGGVDYTWIFILEKAFNLKKSAIYNYINLYNRFADRPEFENYGLSQLTELSTLKDEQVKEIVDCQLVTPETKIKDIREIKKKYKLDDQIADIQETGEVKEKPTKKVKEQAPAQGDQKHVGEYEEAFDKKQVENSEKAKKYLNERYLSRMEQIVSYANTIASRYKQIAIEIQESPKNMVLKGESKAYKMFYKEISRMAADFENDYIGSMQYYDVTQLRERTFKSFDIDNWQSVSIGKE